MSLTWWTSHPYLLTERSLRQGFLPATDRMVLDPYPDVEGLLATSAMGRSFGPVCP